MSDKERSVAEADDLSETNVALHPPLPADEEEAGKLLGRLIGESAVDMLLERIAGRETAKRSILASKVIWRGSTRAPKA